MHILTEHQREQEKVINQIERQIADNEIKFSMVKPIADFYHDQRLTLTSVHFPHQRLIDEIQEKFIEPLRATDSNHFYYPSSSIHHTIKNVRLIADPPTFSDRDVMIAKQVFDKVIPQHRAYQVYFYRLLLFPTNVALIGTTDPELDAIHLDLDRELRRVGLLDDKVYLNQQYFFCNITLARFFHPVSTQTKRAITQLSESIRLEPYTVDSVSLVTGNATLTSCQVVKTWELPYGQITNRSTWSN